MVLIRDPKTKKGKRVPLRNLVNVGVEALELDIYIYRRPIDSSSALGTGHAP